MRRFALLTLAVVTFVLLAATAPARAVEIQRVVSPGGIEAWLVEDHQNPLVFARFVFRGGAALDPKGKAGLAKLVASTLDEGAGELDSQAFQGRLEDLSITLRFDAALDTFGGQVRTLSETRDEAFRLLRLALTEPRFDAEPVERIRSQILARLRNEAEDADTVASETFWAALFPGHPYGRPTDGSLESVPTIGRDDLLRFVHDRLARDNLLLGVVGDVTAAELGALLDSTFAGLPKTAAPWTVADRTPLAEGQVLVTRKPVPQSAIVFGHAGIARQDPDFYIAYVMNHILGGGTFTARLYDEVREKRGLAYSVYSALYPLDHSALIIGAAGTANARVAETIAVVRREWARLATERVGETELADAKTYLTGSFPLRFTASDSIAANLVAIQLDRLGIDYLDKRNGYIEAVTRDDVKRVAQRLLAPTALTFVVVGEPEGLDGSATQATVRP